MDKPTSHVDWALGSVSYATEPSAPKKDTGFEYEEKPPFEYFNWCIQNIGLWARMFDGAFKDFVIVGDDTDYAQYADINAAIAASKNKIILMSDIEVTAEQDFSLSDGKIIGNGFKIKATAAIAGSTLVVSGNDNDLDIIVENTHTSGIVQNGLLISGDRNQGKAKAYQNGAGTTTDGIDVSGDRNQIDGITHAKAGTLTNGVVDTGTDNDLRVIED